MEIKQLECFLKVAECLNFSRAAEALYISQPALSYQIAELERELGITLFERDRRRVYLTPSGMKMIVPARTLVEQAHSLPERIRAESVYEEGLLRIGFDDTEDHVEMTGITEKIAHFGQLHPGVTLSMICTSFQNCMEQLLDNDLDVAFLILRNRENLPTELAYRIVHESKIVMVVQNNHPATGCEEAVGLMELIFVDSKPRGNTRILRTLEKMKLKPHIRHVDSLPAGFVYVVMGKGIMLLSETYFEAHYYSKYKALSIPDDAAKIFHVMVWNKGSDNPMIKHLIDCFS